MALTLWAAGSRQHTGVGRCGQDSATPLLLLGSDPICPCRESRALMNHGPTHTQPCAGATEPPRMASEQGPSLPLAGSVGPLRHRDAALSASPSDTTGPTSAPWVSPPTSAPAGPATEKHPSDSTGATSHGEEAACCPVHRAWTRQPSTPVPPHLPQLRLSVQLRGLPRMD